MSVETTDKPSFKSFFKKLLPHVLVILGGVILVSVFFLPVLKGMQLDQWDFGQHVNISHEIREWRKNSGEEPLWTNAIFGGMPAYQISTEHPGNLFYYIDVIFWLGFPYGLGSMIKMFLGFYFLLSVLRLKPWTAGIGAAAFLLSTMFFGFIGEGHNTKLHAISYMAPLLASVILAYRGKWKIGIALTAFFTALELSASHLQVTYYLLFVLGAYVIVAGIKATKEKKLKSFALITLGLCLAGALGALAVTPKMWTVREYAKISTRGKSDLKTETKRKNGDGIEFRQAIAWSYGPSETPSLLVPNFAGGSTKQQLKAKSETHKALTGLYGKAQADKLIKEWPTYWGPQPSISAPVYVGAVVFYLAILAMFLIKGPEKWAFLGIALIAILLAWGRHIYPLAEFTYNYLPLYNKFRAASLFMVVPMLILPLLAFWGLHHLLQKTSDEERKRQFKFARRVAEVLGMFILLFLLLGPEGTSIYTTGAGKIARSLGMSTDSPEVVQLVEYLKAERAAMFRMDLIRSAVLIGLALGLILLFLKKKIKKEIVLAGIAILVIADLWLVGKRYNNESDYVEKSKFEENFDPSVASTQINARTDNHDRVLQLYGKPFSDGKLARFHRLVGGYHPAKIGRYQELIEAYLEPQQLAIDSMIKAGVRDSILDEEMAGMQTLNMMDARFLISHPQTSPVINPHAFGPAWIVSHINYAKDAEEELELLGKADLLNTAILREELKDEVGAYELRDSVTGTVELNLLEPRTVSYRTALPAEAVVIFSEIFYDHGKGWKARIDGEEVPHFRANYVLRGLKVPAGEHTIEFKFEPRAFLVGNKIALFGSISVILLLLGAGGWEIYSRINRSPRQKTQKSPSKA